MSTLYVGDIFPIVADITDVDSVKIEISYNNGDWMTIDDNVPITHYTDYGQDPPVEIYSQLRYNWTVTCTGTQCIFRVTGDGNEIDITDITDVLFTIENRIPNSIVLSDIQLKANKSKRVIVKVYDQSETLMTGQTVSLLATGGTISNGLYTAGDTLGNFALSATCGSISTSADVYITNSVVKKIGSTWRLKWGDFLSSTVTIQYNADDAGFITITDSAPNQSIDEGYYDWVLDISETFNLIVRVIDNGNPDIYLDFLPITVLENVINKGLNITDGNSTIVSINQRGRDFYKVFVDTNTNELKVSKMDNRDIINNYKVMSSSVTVN